MPVPQPDAASERETLGLKLPPGYRLHDDACDTGGCGRVYHVVDALGREAAFKIALDAPDSIEGLENEIAVYRKHWLDGYALELYDAGEIDGLPYLVTEWLERVEEIAPDEALAFILFSIDALACLHTHKWIHADIKPSCYYRKGKGFRMGDFNTCGPRKELTARGALVGTPGFIAPEVEDRRLYSPQSDMWSLTKTYHVLLTLETCDRYHHQLSWGERFWPTQRPIALTTLRLSYVWQPVTTHLRRFWILYALGTLLLTAAILVGVGYRWRDSRYKRFVHELKPGEVYVTQTQKQSKPRGINGIKAIVTDDPELQEGLRYYYKKPRNIPKAISNFVHVVETKTPPNEQERRALGEVEALLAECARKGYGMATNREMSLRWAHMAISNGVLSAQKTIDWYGK